jgi:hypothetical protein
MFVAHRGVTRRPSAPSDDIAALALLLAFTREASG